MDILETASAGSAIQVGLIVTSTPDAE